MASPHSTQTYSVNLQTPLGEIQKSISFPHGFIPVSEVVPIMQSLGQQAQQPEVDFSIKQGHPISCAKGCAACCRLMIPVSPPEAFVLLNVIQKLPRPRAEVIRNRINDLQASLQQANLLKPLQELADSSRQMTDEELEPINRAYYALRIPCPFLEEEACSIYHDRPAACRELLVTSPPDLCSDMVHNSVQALPIPLRVGTILGKLWSNLTGGPTRLIPLPLALDWAERHQKLGHQTWLGTELIDKALNVTVDFLRYFFQERKRTPSSFSKGQP